ncbi:MAG: hypothetical protein WKF84_14455 [Pyrinomonadaceae bacterium]
MAILRNRHMARLAWTQIIKRSPINFRSLAGVPVGTNSKGLALFALAMLSRYRTKGYAADKQEAKRLLDMLLQEQLKSASGATAWGYNFDWQGRAFFAPRGNAHRSAYGLRGARAG